jgi:hypothetical protein
MKKNSSKSKIKTIKSNYLGINIRLKSNNRKGDSAYVELINKIAELGYEKISLDKAMTIRTLFRNTADFKGTSHMYFHGKLTKFTFLDGGNWLNLKNKDLENYDLPVNLYPNACDADFVFIPSAHRFFIKINNKISLISLMKFLSAALNTVVPSDELFEVTMLQSQDVIDEILSSKKLSRLKVNISYTNDDLGDIAEVDIDDLLRGAQVGNLDMILKPDQNEYLDTQSNFVKGVLKVAKDNGSAEASIENIEGKTYKINTSEHPEKFQIESKKLEEIPNNVFKLVMDKYRNK